MKLRAELEKKKFNAESATLIEWWGFSASEFIRVELLIDDEKYEDKCWKNFSSFNPAERAVGLIDPDDIIV